MNPEAGLDDLMRTAAQVNQSVSQVRGHGESAGGWVKIEVIGDGAISNMYLDDRARTMPAHELGRAIREAQRIAIADALKQIQQIQAQITENSYVSTIFNHLKSSPSRATEAPATRQVRGIPRITSGMTEDEMDASQEAFNFDPLGRRNRRS
ncbi:YbaB/EbfC family nucleoid-associated protein [Mycobacteroides abscessus]|uniref:YbaB/EbfC family nucleoid-associated protein n=1 Tax=Mycobacteroides abscessus TaxID=36809 RepID=UPI0009419ACE|nr:YbaB/EbfC family nucleoid-associated protein [Mycobacteroides abscessus]